MKSLRFTALSLGLVMLMAGCGAAPATTAVRAQGASQMDARSKEGLRAALKIYLSSLFKRLDTNGDNKLSESEAGAFFTKEQFQNLNTNNNPYISLNEVLNNGAFVANATAKLHDYASSLLEQIDTSKDGKLTWNEYLASLNANASLTTGERTYAQLAFNLADQDHNGYLVLDEYEDMVGLAMVQTATTAATLVDAYQKASAHVAMKYGSGLVPMGVSIRWMNKNGNFTKDEGCYAFTFWSAVEGKGNTYNEVLAKVYQTKDPASARDVSAVHTVESAPAPIDYSKLLSPTKAIEFALNAGVPSVGDRTSYFVQYVAAASGMPDRIYVDAYQTKSGGDVRLGGITLEAATGEPMSAVSKGPNR